MVISSFFIFIAYLEWDLSPLISANANKPGGKGRAGPPPATCLITRPLIPVPPSIVFSWEPHCDLPGADRGRDRASAPHQLHDCILQQADAVCASRVSLYSSNRAQAGAGGTRIPTLLLLPSCTSPSSLTQSLLVPVTSQCDNSHGENHLQFKRPYAAISPRCPWGWGGWRPRGSGMIARKPLDTAGLSGGGNNHYFCPEPSAVAAAVARPSDGNPCADSCRAALHGPAGTGLAA